jgi:hypothetical protein
VTDQPIVWQTLGIPGTRDVASIRKAYASRLKECHPEEDPAGFQRVRAAYETALHTARGAIAAAPPERTMGVPEATAPITGAPAPSVAAALAESDEGRCWPCPYTA